VPVRLLGALKPATPAEAAGWPMGPSWMRWSTMPGYWLYLRR
jgi:hypothetical protein